MFDSCTYIGGGRIHFHSNQTLRNRAITHHRILFMKSGQGTFIFDKICVSITHGHVYLLAPGTREAYYSDNAPVAYEYLEFDSPRTLIDKPCMCCRVEPPFRNALIHLIRCTVQESGPLRRQLLAATIGLALHGSSMSHASDARLRRALNHIEDHPDYPTTISGLADLAGLSEPQLRRIFQTELGVSPKQFLMRARMDYAKRLIRAEGLRVKEVADLLGFPSSFQFSAQYRKVHGNAPTQDTRP